MQSSAFYGTFCQQTLHQVTNWSWNGSRCTQHDVAYGPCARPHTQL